MSAERHDPKMDPRFSYPKYLLVRQLFKLLGSNFRVFDPEGRLVAFVHQKAFKLREDIRVYDDESKSREILTIKARSIMDFSAAYDVMDPIANVKVGALKRKGWTSIVRDKWIIMDPNDQEVGEITEDKMILALVRRFLTALVPQSFDVMLMGRKVCDLHQRFNPFVYKLDIDLNSDPQFTFDRRMAFACAILLSAIEGRQRG